MSSASAFPAALVSINQGEQIDPVELNKLLNRSLISQEERAEIYREIAGRMSEVINAATNSQNPKVAWQAIELLMNLAENSERRKDVIWGKLAAPELSAIVKLATTQGELNAASIALLSNLINRSDVRSNQLRETLTKANYAAIVASATSPKPQTAAAMALLTNLILDSEVTKETVWSCLMASGYANIISAISTAGSPQTSLMALRLLSTLADGSKFRATSLSASLSVTGITGVVAAATTPNQPEMAAKALRLLFDLSNLSPSLNAQIWTTLGAADRAAICHAATSPAQPKLAVQALRLLANLAANSENTTDQLWATLRVAQRAALITVATTTAQPIGAEQALRLLANLVGSSECVSTSVWETLGPTGRAAVVASATTPAQPRVAEQALRLLDKLLIYFDLAKAEEIWNTLNADGRATVLTMATTPAQPAVAVQALVLLSKLTEFSEVRKVGLWTSLGAVGCAAVITMGINLAQPRVAEKALGLLYNLAAYSDARHTELWVSLGVADRRGLIIAATTTEEIGVASIAIKLLNYFENHTSINTEIWPLLQPRLAQLWALTQRPIFKQQADNFLLKLIYLSDQRTRDVLDVAITDVSLRHTIATLREWGRLAADQQPAWRIMLQTVIVQTNITPQKMAVLMAAMMSGTNLWRSSYMWRVALRDQVLAIPMAEGIDPTLFREHMRLGLDAACGNSAAVIESQVLTAAEKLQLLEILYSREFLSARVTQDDLLRLQLTSHLSLDFKLQAIGLILTHGQASHFQFKEILTWFERVFKRDPQTGELTNRPTVFSNPSTLGDIGDAAIFALTEQRDQYLALYQNFRPHMTRDFIQEEIEHIERRVSGKEMPQNFGAILIHQLRQFLSIDWPMSALEEERMFDRKS
jgi:hypothetical protein